LGVGQVGAARIASRGVEVEAELRAGHEGDLALGEAADTQLGPLQVHQHADRTAELDLDLADQAVTFGVVLVAAVAEVEPEHVRAGLGQGADAFAGGARRPEGGEDAGAAFAIHLESSAVQAAEWGLLRAWASR